MTVKLRKIKSFARRVGKSLREEAKNLLENFLPNFEFTEPINSTSVILDIGFGAGDQLAENACLNPDKLFIGCEPFLNGVVNLLKLIKSKQIKNILIWPNDVHDLFPKLPDNYLQEVYILFPDPWPKKYQHKRRIINHAFLDILATKMQTAGRIYIATDHEGYAQWISDHLVSNQHWQDTGSKEFPQEWVKSRYQKKADAAGLKPFFFNFIKYD